jgi:hypothetical protein
VLWLGVFASVVVETPKLYQHLCGEAVLAFGLQILSSSLVRAEGE